MFAPLRHRIGSLGLLLTASHLVHSQNTNNNNAAAVFVYPTDSGPDFVFALNAADNGDLSMHLEGPSKYSWLGVGIGEDMADNLMFILYEGSGKDSVTLSPRVAFNGESEPSYYPAVTCSQVNSKRKRDSSSSSSETMSVDAVCHNATSWQGGSLDLNSSSQTMMFAFGPSHELHSDSMDAPLIRHELYANFDMNMAKATTSSNKALSPQADSVPQPNGPNGSGWVSLNAGNADGVTSDGDSLGVAHGVIACVAYIALYPLGALLLRLMKKMAVRLHWITQLTATVLIVVSLATGLYESQYYNRSRDYDDPHQVIGIILFIMVVVQASLGTAHHMIFKKKGKSSIFGKVHLIVGPTIIFLAMVNGGLGLNLALAGTGAIAAYSVLIAVWALALIGLRVWIAKRSTPARKDPESENGSMRMGENERGRTVDKL